MATATWSAIVPARLSGRQRRRADPTGEDTLTPDTRAQQFESLQRINSIRQTNGSFNSCNSCKWLGPAVYMSKTLRLFHVSNIFVVNFRFCLLVYPGSPLAPPWRGTSRPCPASPRHAEVRQTLLKCTGNLSENRRRVCHCNGHIC